MYNLAAEMKYGLTPEVYQEKVTNIVKHCTLQAIRQGAKKWVEVSTAQVYSKNKVCGGWNCDGVIGWNCEGVVGWS